MGNTRFTYGTSFSLVTGFTSGKFTKVYMYFAS